MKYKYYTANIACRDNRTRTLTITTDATDNTKTKHIDLTALQIQMPTETDVFTPLRPQNGTITIVCNNGISPLDFMPSSYHSHEVVIMQDTVCEFYGYISCESRTQTYPSEGEEFDISIVSPLALADSIRFEINNSLSPHNIHSNELDQILWLVTYGYLKCGGNEKGYIYTTERFMEMLPRYCSLEESGDKDIDNNDILRPRPQMGKTYGDILRNIATFYGITFAESGHDLIAISPTGHYLIWHNSLSDPNPYNLTRYRGPISSTPNQLAYGSQDIENPPSRVTVNCSLDTTKSLLVFDEEKLYRPIPITAYTNYDFAEVASNENNERIPVGVTKMSAESVDGNMAANTISHKVPIMFDHGGSFCLFGEQTDYEGDEYFPNEAPSGLVLVSSATIDRREYEIEAGTLRSESYISHQAQYLYLKFTVASMVQPLIAGAPKRWYPCCTRSIQGESVPTSGHVDVRFTINGVKTEWKQAIAHFHKDYDVADAKYKWFAYSKINCVDCDVFVPLTNDRDESIPCNIEVEFRCRHYRIMGGTWIWQYDQYCTDMFIYNIELVANAYQSHFASDIAKNLNQFKFSESTGFSGEEYTVDIPFSCERKGFSSVFNNGIFDKDGGSLGDFKYEKEYLGRIFGILSHPRVTLNLPTEICSTSVIAGGVSPLADYDNEAYLTTGYSRDYMTGIDTISITKIS